MDLNLIVVENIGSAKVVVLVVFRLINLFIYCVFTDEV